METLGVPGFFIPVGRRSCLDPQDDDSFLSLICPPENLDTDALADLNFDSFRTCTRLPNQGDWFPEPAFELCDILESDNVTVICAFAVGHRSLASLGSSRRSKLVVAGETYLLYSASIWSVRNWLANAEVVEDREPLHFIWPRTNRWCVVKRKPDLFVFGSRKLQGRLQRRMAGKRHLGPPGGLTDGRVVQPPEEWYSFLMPSN